MYSFIYYYLIILLDFIHMIRFVFTRIMNTLVNNKYINWNTSYLFYLNVLCSNVLVKIKYFKTILIKIDFTKN